MHKQNLESGDVTPFRHDSRPILLVKRRVMLTVLLLLGSVGVFSPLRVFALPFPDRPAVTNLEYGVDVGTWCGRAAEERRKVLGNTNLLLPRCQSQREYLIGLKSAVVTCLDDYVNHTMVNGFSFNNYFASTKTAFFPMWTMSNILVEVGHPTNYFFVTPQVDLSTSDYGWNGLRLALNLLRATWKMANASNAYEVIKSGGATNNYWVHSFYRSPDSLGTCWGGCYGTPDPGTNQYDGAGVDRDLCDEAFTSLVTSNKPITTFLAKWPYFDKMCSYEYVYDEYGYEDWWVSADPSDCCYNTFNGGWYIASTMSQWYYTEKSYTGFLVSASASSYAADVYLYEQITNNAARHFTNEIAYSVLDYTDQGCTGYASCDPYAYVHLMKLTNVVVWDLYEGLPSQDLFFPHNRQAKILKPVGSLLVSNAVSYSLDGAEYKKWERLPLSYAYNQSCPATIYHYSGSPCASVSRSVLRNYTEGYDRYDVGVPRTFQILKLMHLYVWDFAFID